MTFMFGKALPDEEALNVFEGLHLQVVSVSASKFEPLPPQWVMGSLSLTKDWEFRTWTITARSSMGSKSPVEIVRRLEEVGYLIDFVEARSVPRNEPITSMFNGFQGFVEGIIEESITISAREIRNRLA